MRSPSLACAIAIVIAFACGSDNNGSSPSQDPPATLGVWVSKERLVSTSALDRQEIPPDPLDPINIRKKFAQGETQWEPLLAALDDFYFVNHRRRECGRKHGDDVANQTTSTKMCNIRMNLLLVQQDSTCTIEAVDVRPIRTEAPELFCPDYARCLAEARLGASVPCPTAPSERFAVSLWLQALHQPKLFDPEFVDRLIEAHEEAKKESSQTEPSSPQEAYMQRMANRYVEYLKWHRTTLD